MARQATNTPKIIHVVILLLPGERQCQYKADNAQPYAYLLILKKPDCQAGNSEFFHDVCNTPDAVFQFHIVPSPETSRYLFSVLIGWINRIFFPAPGSRLLILLALPALQPPETS